MTETSWPRAPVFSRDEIAALLPPPAVLQAVRDSYIAHARGEIVSPPPGALLFDDPPGDCHIKFGYRRGDPVFVVKIATGFYRNPEQALPTNNGLVAAFSAVTGATLAIFEDGGLLTSLRTAAAGALAARAGAPRHLECLGILGAGHQAELQAEWASLLLGNLPVVIWGRDEGSARRLVDRLLARGIPAKALATAEDVLACSQVVISCTPARRPIVKDAAVRPGTHLVALGSDSPGKLEIESALFARAEGIATDDHGQCLHHGDFGAAVRQDVVPPTQDVSLGLVLAGEADLRKSDQGITVADLTGLPAHDVAMASLALSLMAGRAGTSEE